MAKPKVPRYDVDALKQAAVARGWPAILTALCGFPPDILDGQHHPCPRCGGTDRFRLIDADRGACLCNQCFHQQNGDGLAAIQWALGVGFPEACRLLADLLGIEPITKNRQQRTLHALPWPEPIARLYGSRKPPITAEALWLAGARYCAWGDTGETVFALPVHSPKLDGSAVGHVLLRPDGKAWPAYGKRKKPAKVLFQRGSLQGLIGTLTAENREGAKLIFLTEGVSDMLALVSVTPIEQRDAYPTVTNGCGSTEGPQPAHLIPLAGKRIILLRDRDQAGDAGRLKWERGLLPVAREVRSIHLPFTEPEIEQGKKDLRDWLLAGHDLAALLALAETTPVITIAPPPSEPDIAENDDDPHRLARLYLEQFGRHTDGSLTLRFWRDEWHRWNGRAYRPIAESELRAELTQAVKQEFDRLFLSGLAFEGAHPDQEAKAYRVTRPLIANMIQALQGYTMLPGCVEPPAWLDFP